MSAPFELLADCPACRVEGALSETYDPDEAVAALGIAAEAHCRLCRAEYRGTLNAGAGAQGLARRGLETCPGCGHKLTDAEIEAHACAACGTRAKAECVREPDRIADRAIFDAALRRFADEDHEPNVATFVESNFMGLGADEVFERVARGEPVETSFNALFSLFRGNARGGGGARNVGRPTEKEARRPDHTGPGAELPRRPERPHDARAMLLALVSVILADGETHPREQEFLDRVLAAEAQPPLAPEEIAVHRPAEISPRITPARRLEVLEMMTQLACIDGEVDSSEMRLVRAYASAWGIADDVIGGWVERYSARYATDAQRFLRKLKAFFLAPA